jgi:hypothetical protein
MIANEAEYQGARREMQHLRDCLTEVEGAPHHPNRELSIIGIYKKMHHLWEELEAYYLRRSTSSDETACQSTRRTEAAAALAEKG